MMTLNKNILFIRIYISLEIYKTTMKYLIKKVDAGMRRKELLSFVII